MNAQRRKQLDRAIALITEAQSLIMTAQEEEQEYFDNMPEALQDGDKGSRASEVADELETAASECDEIINRLEEAKA